MTRFAVLMFFLGVIATGGVLTDSTAVVIGAMLIAPLMTPLMAIAISIVMGWPNRLARSALRFMFAQSIRSGDLGLRPSRGLITE